MHRFIYPIKDTWISEISESNNFGNDSSLEIQKYYSADELRGVSRVLLQFDITDVSKSIASGEISSNAKYNLKLYSSKTHEIPSTYILKGYPLNKNWIEGTGNKDGVTWSHIDKRQYALSWSLSDNVSSGSRSVSFNYGGGTWYTGSGFEASQSFSYQDPDVDMDITNIFGKWISGSSGFSYPYGITNNGIILKLSGSYESGSSTDRFNLNFLSKDNRTIYCPKIEIKWDDHKPCTGSNTGSLNELDISGLTDNYIYMKGIRDIYGENETVKFRIGSENRITNKSYSTSVESISGSYISEGSGSYSIIDVATGETIVPFSSYTSMSCDSYGNYFNQDLTSFQSNRIYKILLKIRYNDNQERIFSDDSFTFKIAR